MKEAQAPFLLTTREALDFRQSAPSTMADSNLPANLDVRILGFNIFCDRLSTIEDQLERLTNNALPELLSFAAK